jgi:hypothetical protein
MIKRKGIVKRFKNGNCWDDKCFHCGAETKILADLSDKELEQYAEEHQTMEATIYYCPGCGARYLGTEKDDYDVIEIAEIEVDPQRPTPVPKASPRYFAVDPETYESIQKHQAKSPNAQATAVLLVGTEVYRQECWCGWERGHRCGKIFYCKGDCKYFKDRIEIGNCLCFECMMKELNRNPKFWNPNDKCDAIFDEKTRNALNKAKIIAIDPALLALEEHGKNEHSFNTDMASTKNRTESGETTEKTSLKAEKMKIDTSYIKTLIEKWIIEEEITIPAKNWKRTSKRKTDDGIEREFRPNTGEDVVLTVVSDSMDSTVLEHHFILYPQKVPEEIRKKRLAYVPKKGKKHDRKQLEKLARKTFQDLSKGKI